MIARRFVRIKQLIPYEVWLNIYFQQTSQSIWANEWIQVEKSTIRHLTKQYFYFYLSNFFKTGIFDKTHLGNTIDRMLESTINNHCIPTDYPEMLDKRYLQKLITRNWLSSKGKKKLKRRSSILTADKTTRVLWMTSIIENVHTQATPSH